MKPLLPLIFITASALAQQATPPPAQQATPPPKKDPFSGFGHTALDQPAGSRRSQPGETPAGPGGSPLDRAPAQRPPQASPAALAATPPAGSLLDRRPPGARFVTPPPSISTVVPLAPAHGLNFDAKTTASGGESSVTRSTTGGLLPILTETMAHESHPVLEMRVNNLGEQPDTAHFDWFFIAKTTSGKRLFVWDQDERDIPIPPHAEQTERLESKDLARERIKETRFEEQHYVTIYSDGTRDHTKVVVPVSAEERRGATPEGWIVRMFVQGKLAKVQASSNALELIGRDPDQLDALVPRKPTVINQPGVAPLPGTAPRRSN